MLHVIFLIIYFYSKPTILHMFTRFKASPVQSEPGISRRLHPRRRLPCQCTSLWLHAFPKWEWIFNITGLWYFRGYKTGKICICIYYIYYRCLSCTHLYHDWFTLKQKYTKFVLIKDTVTFTYWSIPYMEDVYKQSRGRIFVYINIIRE